MAIVIFTPAPDQLDLPDLSFPFVTAAFAEELP